MKSLQAALQKQLDEANERAEKQQATVRLRPTDRQHALPPKQACHLSHRALGVLRSLPSSLLLSIFTSLHHLIETLRKGLIRPGVFSLTPTLK